MKWTWMTMGLAAMMIAAGAVAVGAEAGQPAPAAEAKPAEPPKAEEPRLEGKLVHAQWLALYLAGKKIGYTTQSLYLFPDGSRRLQTNTFLKKTAGADKAGYSKSVTADVDAKFRPQSVECRVFSGDRSWQVTGKAEGGQLVLTRKVGETSATAKIPIDDDVTFLSWALPATVLGRGKTDEGRRWLVIDESLGTLLPGPCLARVLGVRPTAGPGGGTVQALAVAWMNGAEHVAHMVDPQGRVLRSIWQTMPMVAEATSLTEARRLLGAPDGPAGVAVEGLESEQRYHHPRLGLTLTIPPYPWVALSVAEAGAVEVRDLTDEASLYIHPVTGLRMSGEAPAEAEVARTADLVQREWASRWDEIKAEPVRTERAGDREAPTIVGTARMGCTTFHFRNQFVSGNGLTWLVSALVPDRAVAEKPALLGTVMASMKWVPPEGQLPLVGAGDVLRSPFYGFEIRKPGPRWKVPAHQDGPTTVLELARDDQAAVAIVRAFTLRAGQTLESFVASQAQDAADNLDVKKPDPKETTLGGRAALEFAYEAKKVLAGRPARCTLIYTKVENRLMSLVLIAAADADESAVKELGELRESLKFAK